MPTQAHVLMAAAVISLAPRLAAQDVPRLVTRMLASVPIDSICEARCSVVLVDPEVLSGMHSNARARGAQLVATISPSSLAGVGPRRPRLALRGFDPERLGHDTAGYKVSVDAQGPDSLRIYVEVFGFRGRLPVGHIIAQGVARRSDGEWRFSYAGEVEP